MRLQGDAVCKDERVHELVLKEVRQQALAKGADVVRARRVAQAARLGCVVVADPARESRAAALLRAPVKYRPETPPPAIYSVPV
jgi:hypothetical protein